MRCSLLFVICFKIRFDRIVQNFTVHRILWTDKKVEMYWLQHADSLILSHEPLSRVN